MIDTDKEPAPYGLLWTIAENFNKRGIIKWDKKRFKDALFIHSMQMDGSIRGNDLFEYFKEKHTPVLNAAVWEYLKDNPTQIPEEWKKKEGGNEQYIFFWGTIDRSPQGNLYVRYITWTGGNWAAGSYLLSGNWHEDFPAAVWVK
ncbi:MAG: hypothetical protein V4438_04010 [Patescibacteria group bacterium]